MTGPAPGWYDDPTMANTRRYWDGEQWTEHRAPEEQVTVAAGSSAGFWTITRAVTVGILVAIAAVWIFYSIAHSNDGLDCATENADRAMNGQALVDCPD